MQYAEFSPHPALTKIIECYWSLAGQAHDVQSTVYPDGCMDILYDFSGGVTSSDEARTAIVGNMTRPIQTYASGHVDMLGIRFRPAGLSWLVKTPLSDFNDLSVPLSECIQLPDEIRLHSLQGKNLPERIQILNHFFLKKLIPASPASAVWNQCLQEVLHANGNVSIASLSEKAGISQKHLERKFREHVGLTPKQLALVLRFRELKTRLEKSQGDLLQLALDLNYTDHAHLTKSFKSFAGITPTEYLRSAR